MQTITRIFLRSALVAAFLTTVSVGVAQAQYGGGDWGGGDGDSDCSVDSSNHYRGNFSIVGLTSDQRLICFGEFRPGSAATLSTINGLAGDSRLVGVDFRPATGNDGDGGDLYGLGDLGGVYVINVQTGQVTLRSRLNVALSGTSFGIDFNPVVDRLRIVSDNGQNLRANVDTGATIVDGVLNYTPGTPATGITGAAYTNNDADPNTATSLYNIDSSLDQMNTQAPPNAGTLNLTGKLTVNTTPDVGFDIYSTIRNNSTVNVEGFASLVVGGSSRFYSIALFSGKASSRGSFSSQNQVVDIAIPLNQR